MKKFIVYTFKDLYLKISLLKWFNKKFTNYKIKNILGWILYLVYLDDSKLAKLT